MNPLLIVALFSVGVIVIALGWVVTAREQKAPRPDQLPLEALPREPGKAVGRGGTGREGRARFGLVSALFGLAVAGGLIWLGLRYQAQAIHAWRTTPGSVVSSGVTDLPGPNAQGRGIYYAVFVQYTYAVDGVSHTSNRIGDYTEGARYDDWSRAESVAGRYPPGKTVLVYYNPQNPRIAVLEPGVVGMAWVIWAMAGGALVVSAWLGILGIRARR